MHLPPWIFTSPKNILTACLLLLHVENDVTPVPVVTSKIADKF